MEEILNQLKQSEKDEIEFLCKDFLKSELILLFEKAKNQDLLLKLALVPHYLLLLWKFHLVFNEPLETLLW